jgi:hypothetical protein
MAMKKKTTAKKPKGDANYDMLLAMYGSDTGVRNKAANAQKKSQMKNAANKGAGFMKNAATSKKNDLAGGRTSTRGYNQTANAFRALGKKAAIKKTNAKKVAKGKK